MPAWSPGPLVHVQMYIHVHGEGPDTHLVRMLYFLSKHWDLDSTAKSVHVVYCFMLGSQTIRFTRAHFVFTFGPPSSIKVIVFSIIM